MPDWIRTIGAWLQQEKLPHKVDAEKGLIVVCVQEAFVSIERKVYGDEALYLLHAPISFGTRIVPELLQMFLQNTHRAHIGAVRIDEQRAIWLRHALHEHGLTPEVLLSTVWNLALIASEQSRLVVSLFGGLYPAEHFQGLPREWWD